MVNEKNYKTVESDRDGRLYVCRSLYSTTPRKINFIKSIVRLIISSRIGKTEPNRYSLYRE